MEGEGTGHYIHSMGDGICGVKCCDVESEYYIDFKNSIMEEFTQDMIDWINDGNVVKTGNDAYIEQTTQWKVVFTKQKLIEFFIREF